MKTWGFYLYEHKCSTKLLVHNHKGLFKSGFTSQLIPLSWCLALDISFLEGVSWLLSLMDWCFTFPCKKSFLTWLSSSLLCSAIKSKYVYVSFLLPWLNTSDCGSYAYLLFFFLYSLHNNKILLQFIKL